jgi:hypothetical protein
LVFLHVDEASANHTLLYAWVNKISHYTKQAKISCIHIKSITFFLIFNQIKLFFMSENQVTLIPAAVITQAVDLATQLNTLLAPYMQALTAAERHGILKMGDKTIAFVNKTLDYAQTQPQFAPTYMNTQELANDVEVVNGLTRIEQPIANLASQLNDTIMIGGSEAYVAALMYYNSVKEAVKRNVPAAKAIYEDLKMRFERAHEKKPLEKTTA